ncbi:MAG: hypothetical protein LBD24_04675 [Spirochaetaceae bacterium]|nr:hypothetical protein [Spirochaetaceae bacterium]
MRRLLRITTHSFQTARRCAKRSRALTVAGNVTGLGVALLGNNRRPYCATGAAGAKRSRALTAIGEVNGHGVALLGNNRRPCLKPSEAAA